MQNRSWGYLPTAQKARTSERPQAHRNRHTASHPKVCLGNKTISLTSLPPVHGGRPAWIKPKLGRPTKRPPQLGSMKGERSDLGDSRRVCPGNDFSRAKLCLLQFQTVLPGFGKGSEPFAVWPGRPRYGNQSVLPAAIFLSQAPLAARPPREKHWEQVDTEP